MSGQVVNPGDNLVPGQVYTFTFDLENLITSPSASDLQNDLTSQEGAGFVDNVLVGVLAGLPARYAVTFTYDGDGTDTASDVWNGMINDFSSGSNDNLSFYAASMGSVPTAQQAITQAATTVGSTVGSAAAGLIGGAAKAATANVSFDIVLVIGLVGLAAFLLFEVGGLSGLKETFA
jgi:hypothetical protein